jgi:hypothetical protein
MEEEVCKKCRGTGRVMDKDGSIHTCFECLNKGEMDQHDKRLKSADELRIKL